MKKKYDIQINPPELDADRIAAHKDFDRLLADYQQLETRTGKGTSSEVGQIAWGKIGLSLGALTLVVVVIGLVVQSLQSPETTEDPQEKIISPKTTAQPLPTQFAMHRGTWQSDYDTHRVDSIWLDENVLLVVPAASLETTDGHPITTPVSWSYEVGALSEEQKKLLDKAGVQANYGLDIQGAAGGKKVVLRQDSKLKLCLFGNLSDSKKHPYHYVSMAQKWEPQSLQAQYFEPQFDSAAFLQRFPKPTPPISTAAPSDYVFELDIKAEEFPELSSYKQLAWAALPEAGQDLESIFEEAWENIQVQRVTQGEYRLILTRGSHEEMLRARPVQQDAEAVAAADAVAQASYKKAVKQHQKAFEAWKNQAAQAAEIWHLSALGAWVWEND